MNNTPASPGTEPAQHMSRGAGIALLVILVVAVGAFVGATFASKHEHDASHIAAAEAKAEMEALGVKPYLNTAGDHVYATMFISDGTGVVTTPNDAGVFTAIAGAPLLTGETDGSGCITASATTGLFTASLRCGIGEWLATACLNRFSSSSNVAGTTTGAWVISGTAIAATVAPRFVRTETVDAGNTEASPGCINAIIDVTTVGDTVGFEYANAGGGITATTKAASFTVTKLLNK